MKRVFYGVCILPVLLLCGCEQTNNYIQDDVAFLTSEECAGRLYATEGNEAAANYIADQLFDAGLVPFSGEAMQVPFTAELPTDIQTQCTLHSSDRSLSLTEGTDYIPAIWGSLVVEGELVASADGAEESFQVVQDGEVLLTLKQTTTRYGWQGYLPGSTPSIALTEAGAEKVSSFAGEQVSYRCNANFGTIELDNILAVLPGEDRSRAVVLGAHFDHVGQVGDVIYSGAVDNASGVGVVLQTARLAAATKPQTDIVFAFWNTEEHGSVGSAAGAEALKSAYEEICYINVDCVGYTDGGIVEVSTMNDSFALQSEVANLLQEVGYSNVATSDITMASDHRSFAFCSSINLGHGEAIGRIIHKPIDTADQLNYAELDAFAQSLAFVLTKSTVALLETKESDDMQQPQGDIVWPEGNYAEMTEAEQRQYRVAVSRQLAYDEYVLLPNGNKTMQVRRETAMTLAEVQTYYPGFSVPETIGEFSLAGIYISDSVLSKDEDPPNFTVLQWTPSADTIDVLQLLYCAEDIMVQYSYYYYGNGYKYAATNLSGSCDSMEPMDAAESVWLCHSDEGLGYSYIIEGEEACMKIRVGKACVLADTGATCVLGGDYAFDRDTYLSIIAPFLSNPPAATFAE